VGRGSASLFLMTVTVAAWRSDSAIVLAFSHISRHGLQGRFTRLISLVALAIVAALRDMFKMQLEASEIHQPRDAWQTITFG
jgi:hypothetical protein